MKIPKDTAEKIIIGGIRDIWETFINLENEYPEYDEDYNDVRFGVHVKFEIYDLWEDTKKIVRKDKDGKVIICGKLYTIEDFRTEKEVRRKIMVEAIIKNVAETEVLQSR